MVWRNVDVVNAKAAERGPICATRYGEEDHGHGGVASWVRCSDEGEGTTDVGWRKGNEWQLIFLCENGTGLKIIVMQI